MTRRLRYACVVVLLLLLVAAVQGDAVEAHIGRGYQLVQDRNYESAAAEFEAALAARPVQPRIRYQLAVCYFALGRNGDSRREFDRLRVETADEPAVTYYLGRLDLIAGDFGSAIRRLRTVVSDPPFPDTALYLGIAYMSEGNAEAALPWLEKAAVLIPRDFRVPYRLARAYQSLGRTADAKREYERFSELRQGYADGASQSLECSQALNSSGLSTARDMCRRLFDPNDPDKLTLLGIIYGQHAAYPDAVEALQQAARLDPDSFEIHHNLGLSYFRMRRFADARPALEKAVALRPDFFGSSALLGATLYMLKEDAPAWRALNHAHNLNPQDADTTELLFRVAALLGRANCDARRYREALPYLRQAAALRPSDPEIRRLLASAEEQAKSDATGK